MMAIKLKYKPSGYKNTKKKYSNNNLSYIIMQQH